MQAGEARLSIDCGSANTVAILAWPDGSASVLSFDGSPYLPAAVFVADGGQVWTGRQAWQSAKDQPARFVPYPRRPADGDLTVDGTTVDALEVAAAPLRRAAAEAERAAGGPVVDVRLVVPAGWGPRRRTWMRQVAHRAGLPQPRLVEAPVAVADHLLATGLQLPVGAFIVVCDVGGGAEVTVLRRGPAGFEVLATLADPAAGGVAIDEALTATVTGGQADTDGGGGGHWATAETVRAAKEALAVHPAVTVPLADRPPVVANSAMLADAARPALQRVAQLVQEAIAAAELTVADLAGTYCAGGSASLPQLAAVIAEQTGVAPTVLVEPGFAAARGAADAGAATTTVTPVVEVPVPPIRRAVSIALPGFASLGLIWQCLTTAEENNPLNVYRWVKLNWGEITMAAVCALVACMAAGTVLGSLIAARSPTPGARSEGGKVSVGILAAVSLGGAVAGLYAVVSSQYLRLPVGPFLSWALWPIAPIAVLAVVMAVVAALQRRPPYGGWSALLTAPTGSVVAAALGMGLIQYSLTAERWPDRVLWIDSAGRAGGLLLGVGVVMALVTPLMFRLILSAPVAVIMAAIVSEQAVGILAVTYAIAVAMWWVSRLWTRLVRPAPTIPAVSTSAQLPTATAPQVGG